MLISDLLSPERICCDVHSSSKKRLLELISIELARNSDQLSQREIFESLCARERLGSTGLEVSRICLGMMSYGDPAWRPWVLPRGEAEPFVRRALEREEFALAYQLQADTVSGAFIGVEALLRWHDPEHGLVLPDTFIPVAEDSGLIVPLGEWMLRTACAQKQSWREAGLLDVPVAVNLSARQFDEPTLLDTVARALEDSGLPPARLELELTETLIMRNPLLAAELLEASKRMGILTCIDDFGTGYSSLAYLRRFRIDRLKIDRSFIADIETEPDDATIARTIIAMAHTLRIDVLAEGVETEAQLQMLREWRCDGYQGYLCSRPLPAKELSARLCARQPALRPA